MVATLARAKGYPLGALAGAVGIHRNRLSDKIAGRVAFTEGDILRLAEALGVPPARLFEDPLELLGVRSHDHGLLPSTIWQHRRSGRVSPRRVICRHPKKGVPARPGGLR